MEFRKHGRRYRVYFTYFEWIKAGKKMPSFYEHCKEEEVMEYIISKVPHDRKDFFDKCGWVVRLAGIRGGFKSNKILKQK